jgi:hypothetical protein
MKNGVWVLSGGKLTSIARETAAAVLAEMFPNRIYFFAEMIPHPNHDN